MSARFDEKGWSRGTSFSAVSGSSTMSRIFERMNSDAVSLARRSSAMSRNVACRKRNPPCSHAAS